MPAPTKRKGISSEWQKPMQVMAARESRCQLTGRVEIDDAYFGGERAGEPVKWGLLDRPTRSHLSRSYRRRTIPSRIRL